MSIKLLELQETYQDMQHPRQSKLLLHIWSFAGFQNVKNTNFRNPVFNKGERWNLMTYFAKTRNIQLILAKIYLETSKTRPSTCFLKATLNIFHPSPKTPKFLWHRTKAYKNFFFKSMLNNLYGEHSAWRIKGSADTQTY